MGHFLVPRPIRNILETYREIQQLRSDPEPAEQENQIRALQRQNAVQISRIVIAASAAFALYALSIPMTYVPIAFVIGSAISLPTTLIASGIILGYMGISTIIASMTPFVFTSFATGLGITTIGWFALENYRLRCICNGRMGMGERLSEKFELNEPLYQS